MSTLRRTLMFGLIFLLLTACGTNAPAAASKPSIVATFSVLADMTQQIAGDTATVTSLVPANGDAHTFEPTPANSKEIANATVVIELGLGFEHWFGDLYTASGSKATRITASKGVTTHQLDNELDPHIWHDVANAIIMAQNIRDGLIAAMPSQKATITANAERYIAELQSLDKEVVDQIAHIPAAQRKLVTSHDALGYFAARYGFVIVGTGLASVSTEASDRDAQSTIQLINDIKASGVPAIFIENMSNPKAMEQIAQSAGVQIAPELFTDALGDSNSEGATYVRMMRYNVRTIVTALTRAK